VAKKGGDNLGFSGHKHMKGDKVVAFCDRNCNVIAPFVPAPGNRNESPLLREALPQFAQTARAIDFDLRGTIVSLDGVYDCRANREAIFNRGMKPNINPNPRGRKIPKRGRKPIFDPAMFDERFRTAVFGRLGVLVVRTQLGFFNAPRLTKCIPLIDQVGDSAAFLSL
jgi:hypothetical protein